jgi:hypothetical protein
MKDMEEQLANLKSEYLQQLAQAEGICRQQQAIISDRREKIAAIAILIGGAELNADSHVSSIDAYEDDELGDFTPVGDYWKPILRVLVRQGGRAKRKRVTDQVGEDMKAVLKPADYGKLPKSGDMRWRNRVQWQASNMRKSGLMRKDSPRGIWEITDEGRKWLDDKNA